jgi:hypothetical protein
MTSGAKKTSVLVIAAPARPATPQAPVQFDRNNVSAVGTVLAQAVWRRIQPIRPTSRSSTVINFRVRGLPAHEFVPWFDKSDAELASANALRLIADSDGYPCRISLTDAAPGDEVLLMNYAHHRVNTPYRASFAIYVRPGEQTCDVVDQVPSQLRRRLLSVRGYDAGGMLRAADVVAGTELESVVQVLLQDPRIGYLHVHFAKPGCYAALVERA